MKLLMEIYNPTIKEMVKLFEMNDIVYVKFEVAPLAKQFTGLSRIDDAIEYANNVKLLFKIGKIMILLNSQQTFVN